MRTSFEDLEVGDMFTSGGNRYEVFGVGEVEGERVVFSPVSYAVEGATLEDEFYAFCASDVDVVHTESSLKRLTKSDLIEIVLELQDSM